MSEKSWDVAPPGERLLSNEVTVFQEGVMG